MLRRRSSAVLATVVLAGTLGAVAQPALAAPKPSSSTCRKCDTTAPGIAIGSPAAGASVTGSFTVSGTASDNAGVARVELQVDAGAFVLASGTTSWSLAVSSTGWTNGTHTLTARASDTSGNTKLASVTVSASNQPAADTTAPTVTIGTPSAGSSVSGTLQVSGTAGDNTSVSSVQVLVDGAAATMASGTASWTAALDTASWTSGSHVLTARATDAAGNSTGTSVSVSKATTSAGGADMVLADPVATHPLGLLGRGRMAQSGSLTALLYAEQFTTRRAAFFRDSSTGASSYVDLPSDTTSGWVNSSSVLSSPADLWVLGGDGPVYLRHYRLTGSPVPTSAVLASSQALGDTDSRSGDLALLRSGAVVAVWHQQEMSGPRGTFVGYRSPSGTWQVLPGLTFMPSASSKQVLVQHPADGSLWLFSDPDAWAATGAAHLTETASGLTVDWTNATYLSKNALGEVGPEGENPDLAVAPNPTAGTIDLAFQDAHTQFFSTDPAVKGAYVTVAHIPAGGPATFDVLPTYVERISGLALSVVGGDTWVSYRPVDAATLTWDQLYSSHLAGGTWSPAVHLGRLSSAYQPLTYTSGLPLVGARLADGTVHVFSLS